MITDFPFIRFNPTQHARPILPIIIKNPENGKYLHVWGLIDTGADRCSVPATYASLLGHDLTQGKKIEIGTGNGTTNAYEHTSEIAICGIGSNKNIEYNNIIHTIRAAVDYMPNLNTVLLGVKQFLGNFTLKIEYPKKRFSIYQ